MSRWYVHVWTQHFNEETKLSHLYLYSALYNTDCVKAASQSQQENIVNNARGQ